LTFLVTCLCCT